MAKTKTRWTLAEAKAAALKQFPCKLNRYEIGRSCIEEDGYLGYLLTDLMLGNKESWSRDAKSVVKVNVKTVRAEFQKKMEDAFSDSLIRQWCSANGIQKYDVGDGYPWFEKWRKDEVAV